MIRLLHDIGGIGEDLEKQCYSRVAIGDSLATMLLKLARTFYSLSLDDRMKCCAIYSRSLLGYFPSEAEATLLQRDRALEVPVFSGARARGYSSFDFVGDERSACGEPLFTNMLWPDDSFRGAAAASYAAIADLTVRLSDGLLRLYAPSGIATDAEGPSLSIMRLLRYDDRGQSLPSKTHTDYELVSIIIPSGDGLVVRDRAGAWHRPKLQNGEAVVLAGDMFNHLSAGRLSAGVHRVESVVGERFSVVFFRGLPPSFALRWPVNDSGALPRTFGIHLIGRLLKGAPHLQDELRAWESNTGYRVPERNPLAPAVHSSEK